MRYWCNHCYDSHDTTVGLDRHYREWHEEHIIAERGTWQKQSYQDSRHGSENESDCEKGHELDDTYDEQSDESEYDLGGKPKGETDMEDEEEQGEPASLESSSSTRQNADTVALQNVETELENATNWEPQPPHIPA